MVTRTAIAGDETMEDGFPPPPNERADALASRTVVLHRLFGELGFAFQFGRYRVLGRLGSGGMGRVYAAHDPDLDRPIALKVLRADSERASHDVHRRLVREGRALAALEHPNIVTVYHVGREHGQAYVAMERLEGQTFDGWVRDAQPSPASVLEALIQAGRGLSAAHAAGIVHRDFKPTNVMITPLGAKVLDFGLACAADDPTLDPATQATTQPARTSKRSVTGTPKYMSPEQRRGLALGPASDQFSFCVVAYEALAGRHPFGDVSQWSKRGYPTPAAPTGRGVSRAVARAVLRGLSLHPKDRFPSMARLLEKLAPRRRLPWPLWLTGGVGTIGLVWTALEPATPLGHEPDVSNSAASPPPRSPAVDPAAAEVDVTIRRATALHSVARFAEAVELAEQASVQAEALGLVRGRAEAALVFGRCLFSVERRQEALTELQRAVWLAMKDRDDRIAADAMIALLEVVGRTPPDFEKQGAWARRARRAIERLGGDPAREARVEYELGMTLARAGRFAEAQLRLNAAATLLREHFDPNHPDTVMVLGGLALNAYNAGDLAGAKLGFERALAAARRTLGPRHFEVGRQMGRLASVARQQGRLRDAEHLFGAAIELGEESVGPRSRYVAGLIQNRGNLHLARGDFDAAQADFERATELWEAEGGPFEPSLAYSLTNLGELERRRGDLDRARDLLRRAAVVAESLDPAHHMPAVIAAERSKVERAARQPEHARAHAAAALLMLEATPHAGPFSVATVRFAWAQAHWPGGSESRRQECRRQAELALGVLQRALDPERAALRQEISSWLAKR